ncbi:MAG: O-antigen ligase family protein [bacterium]
MTFLLRNLVLFHVLALAFFFTWVHGGTRGDHLQAVPWLVFLLVNVLVALPQQRKGETLPEARLRVWRGVVHDPLLYIGLGITTLLLWQWLNSGTDWVTGGAAGEAGDSPANLWVPFSVDAQESFQPLYWFAPAFAAMLAVRHGVSRAGQRRLLRYLVWGGALLSVFGWIQQFSGTQKLYWMTPLPAHFFASFGYENFAGAFFTLLFAISGGLWFQAGMDPDEKTRASLYVIPLLLNAAGVMGSLSRAAMLLSAALLLGGGAACLLAAWKRIQIGTRVKSVTYAALLVVLLAGFYFAFPSGSVRRELETIHTGSFYKDTIGARFFLYRSAWDMTKDHPLFGVGGWGYRHFVHAYVTPAELDTMLQGKGMANVHNDTLQFMAEHGLIGFGLLLAAVMVLLQPILQGAWRLLTTRPVVDWDNPYCPPLLRVPAMIYAVLLGCSATLIHSVIDIPFRSPAIVITWCLCLACAPAFLPRPAQPTR